MRYYSYEFQLLVECKPIHFAACRFKVRISFGYSLYCKIDKLTTNLQQGLGYFAHVAQMATIFFLSALMAMWIKILYTMIQIARTYICTYTRYSGRRCMMDLLLCSLENDRCVQQGRRGGGKSRRKGKISLYHATINWSWRNVRLPDIAFTTSFFMFLNAAAQLYVRQMSMFCLPLFLP